MGRSAMMLRELIAQVEVMLSRGTKRLTVVFDTDDMAIDILALSNEAVDEIDDAKVGVNRAFVEAVERSLVDRDLRDEFEAFKTLTKEDQRAEVRKWRTAVERGL